MLAHRKTTLILLATMLTSDKIPMPAPHIPSIPDKTPHDTCTHCEKSVASFASIAEHGWILDRGWITKGDDTATCPHNWFINTDRTQKYREQMKQLNDFVGGEFSTCNSVPAITISFVLNAMSAESDDEADQAEQSYRTNILDVAPGAEELFKMLRDLSKGIGLEVTPLWVAKRLNGVSAKVSGPPSSN